MRELRGTGVAIVTPFKEGEIDFVGLAKCIDHVLAGGVEYIVPLGSTGESATQTDGEKRAVLSFVIDQVRGRIPVVAGNFGGNDTRRICASMDDFDFTGVTAVLSSSPEYNKPTQEGIVQHYTHLARHCPVPIIVYNVPGRTASNITAETAIRLSQIDGICGIKEASGDIAQGRKIIKGTPKEFLVISGDDPSAIGLMRAGGQGVISVIANALPRQFSNMIRHALAEDWAKAAQLDDLVDPVHPYLYVEGNPAGIKGALSHLGLCSGEVRLPLTPLSYEKYKLLGLILDKVLANSPSPVQ